MRRFPSIAGPTDHTRDSTTPESPTTSNPTRAARRATTQAASRRTQQAASPGEGGRTAKAEPGRLATARTTRLAIAITRAPATNAACAAPSDTGTKLAPVSPARRAIQPTRGMTTRFAITPAAEMVPKWAAVIGAVPSAAVAETASAETTREMARCPRDARGEATSQRRRRVRSRARMPWPMASTAPNESWNDGSRQASGSRSPIQRAPAAIAVPALARRAKETERRKAAQVAIERIVGTAAPASSAYATAGTRANGATRRAGTTRIASQREEPKRSRQSQPAAAATIAT